MYGFFKKKSVIIAIFTLIIVSVATAIFGGNDPFTSVVRTVFTPVLTASTAVTRRIASVKAYFIEVDAYKMENERLVNENIQLKKNEKSVAQYRKENERLTELLNLSDELERYETIAAKVVSYEPNNWYDTIVINKGKTAGLDTGDVVISPEGVVGKITDIGVNWAHISSLLSRDNAIATIVSRTDEVAVTEGDAELAQQKLCRLSFVNSAAQIAVGDYLETSGAVGLYPAGLTIGTVKEMAVDSSGTKYAVVEPAVDFTDLHEVLVIKER